MKRINVMFTEHVLVPLDKEAGALGISRSDLIRRILTDHYKPKTKSKLTPTQQAMLDKIS